MASLRRSMCLVKPYLTDLAAPAAESRRVEPKSGALLSLDRVCMDFGGVRAVQNCSFEVNEGQIYSLIGPNGAGKSTVFNIICGIYRPTGGSVHFRDKRIDGKRASEIAKGGVGRTFQNIELFKGMSALQNVMVGAHRHSGYGTFGALFSTPTARKEEQRVRGEAAALLRYVGVDKAAEQCVEDLPYGVQKRVEVARALATEPKILLLDEPAAGLNDSETEALMHLVKRIRDERGVTVLLVEHNMRLVMGVSDRVCALSFGVRLAEGTPKEIQSHPEVVAAYLGEQPC